MIDMSFRPFGSRNGLVLGIANEHSITYGCALGLRARAELAITYLNSNAKPYVEPLAKKREAAIFLPCDVMVPEQRDTVFHEMERTWGTLDLALHAIAFAQKVPDLLPTSQIGLIGEPTYRRNSQPTPDAAPYIHPA